MLAVIENLQQYDLTDQEAKTLIRMGFVFKPDEGDTDYGTGELGIAALVWDDLGLQGDAVFTLFDAVLGRKP